MCIRDSHDHDRIGERRDCFHPEYLSGSWHSLIAAGGAHRSGIYQLVESDHGGDLPQPVSCYSTLRQGCGAGTEPSFRCRRSHLAGDQRLCLRAVSYTHLDVYKRQNITKISAMPHRWLDADFHGDADDGNGVNLSLIHI